jgi:hypothetical protein
LPINQLVYNDDAEEHLLNYNKKKSYLIDDDGYDECDESDDTETIFSYENTAKSKGEENSIDLYNKDTFDSTNIQSISDDILDYSLQTKQFESQIQSQEHSRNV